MSERPDFDPDKIRERLLVVGEDWADKKSAFEALNDLTKTVLADVTANYIQSCASKAESEVRALGDRIYKEHLAGKAAARKEWLRAEVKWKTGVLWAELRRTQESTRRAEANIR